MPEVTNGIRTVWFPAELQLILHVRTFCPLVGVCLFAAGSLYSARTPGITRKVSSLLVRINMFLLNSLIKLEILSSKPRH